MTDPQPGQPQRPARGALLRAAREKQGLHIAALAASIKVAPRKLDALENDRWQTAGRHLHARLGADGVPDAEDRCAPGAGLVARGRRAALEPVGNALNTPFRDRARPR
jgi:cytoskeleton protein RodZ